MRPDEGGRERERERESKEESVCVCVCVSVCEKERERDCGFFLFYNHSRYGLYIWNKYLFQCSKKIKEAFFNVEEPSAFDGEIYEIWTLDQKDAISAARYHCSPHFMKGIQPMTTRITDKQ